MLWRTDEVRPRKPMVGDEIRNGLWYFRESLFQAVPQTYRNLAKAMRRVYGEQAEGGTLPRLPSFLRFGSWIGGDRDGNPTVTPETTVLAGRLQHREVLVEYRDRVHRLRYQLTHSTGLCQPTALFHERLGRDEEAFAPLPEHEARLYGDEPYRRKLFFIELRLQHALARARRLVDESAGETRPRPARRWATATPPSCCPISAPSTSRCVPTATTWSPTASWPTCYAWWRPSACTCSRWTCARNRACTAAPWLTCSRSSPTAPDRSRPTT